MYMCNVPYMHNVHIHCTCTYVTCIHVYTMYMYMYMYISKANSPTGERTCSRAAMGVPGECTWLAGVGRGDGDTGRQPDCSLHASHSAEARTDTTCSPLHHSAPQHWRLVAHSDILYNTYQYTHVYQLLVS